MGLLFVLGVKKACCLAPDKCGVSGWCEPCSKQPEGMIKYSLELLEAGDKYYGKVRISANGVEYLD